MNVSLVTDGLLGQGFVLGGFTSRLHVVPLLRDYFSPRLATQITSTVGINAIAPQDVELATNPFAPRNVSLLPVRQIFNVSPANVTLIR